MERTSQTHPIRIDFVETQFKGLIGLTFCPGKTQMHPQSGAPWNRSLEQDIYDIQNNNTPNLQKITTIVSLIEDGRFSENEFSTLKVEGLGECIQNHGMDWVWLPLEDTETPTREWLHIWDGEIDELIKKLQGGENIVVHCKGGLGRAGTVSALILNEIGIPIQKAISLVRGARNGAIESYQENWLRGNFS